MPAVGGRAGARLAACLPVRASRDVIVREVRRLPDPPSGRVTVLGIDEFAFRRGATYGTVLIDVETRRPVDLLPNRTADTAAPWLAAHPGIKVICRDRCSTFSQAAARAAPPDAIEVADRWHLLHSLARPVEWTAHQQRACLRKDAESNDADQAPEISDLAPLAALIGPPEPADSQTAGSWPGSASGTRTSTSSETAAGPSAPSRAASGRTARRCATT
ncbi:transposase [Streptomyces lavendulae]|uniref:transposase n=1 Tax=Streptomyces lavendulae TaxID=1914 RepID=UPI0024A01ADB|nr:transposase [Streptomyces lavendulae]GLW03439.1 hypothetical protein Slala05_70690 [Streptomyces lavendulae subsp. lavendulae]